MASYKYTVEPGDSYFGLARKWSDQFGIEISPLELLRLNNLNMDSAAGEAGHLSIGQEINIPENIHRQVYPDQYGDTEETPDTGGTEGDGSDSIWDPGEIEDLPEDFLPPAVTPGDAITDLAGDPAYQAFYQQYLLGVEDINTIRADQSLALLGSLQRQFGSIVGDDPWDRGSREGGLFELQEQRALDANLDQFGGRGMGFSGQRYAEAADIRTDIDAKEASTWAEYMAQVTANDQAQRDAFRALEFQRLEAERLARERLAAEEAGAIYG